MNDKEYADRFNSLITRYRKAITDNPVNKELGKTLIDSVSLHKAFCTLFMSYGSDKKSIPADSVAYTSYIILLGYEGDPELLGDIENFMIDDINDTDQSLERMK